MKIIKANGEKVAYDPLKIRASLKRAGARLEMIDEVIAEMKEFLYEGITTKELYKKVFSKLKKLNKTTAGKYHLKHAIMELGPTGFPFEKYISELLKAEGYYTKTDQIVKGHCVQHEVDVVAEKDNQHFMMECKFHSDPGRVCDVKTALYVHARFLDVEKKWLIQPGHDQKYHQGWLVTNTRLTSDAQQYGICSGMGLLSWNFPPKESLRERIDHQGLHPVTCLTTLTKKEKQLLLEKMIVLCKELCKQPEALSQIGLTPARVQRVLTESKAICELTLQR